MLDHVNKSVEKFRDPQEILNVAALYLDASEVGFERQKNVAISAPAFSLLIHALELILKAFLFAQNKDWNCLKKYNHKISDLWTDCMEANIKADRYKSLIGGLVKSFSEFIEADHYMRYPSFEINSIPDPKVSTIAVRGLYQNVCAQLGCKENVTN